MALIRYVNDVLDVLPRLAKETARSYRCRPPLNMQVQDCGELRRGRQHSHHQVWIHRIELRWHDALNLSLHSVVMKIVMMPL